MKTKTKLLVAAVVATLCWVAFLLSLLLLSVAPAGWNVFWAAWNLIFAVGNTLVAIEQHEAIK